MPLSSKWIVLSAAAVGLVLSAMLPVPAMPPPECGDGRDNDGDGAIDYPNDTGCTSFWDNNEWTALPCKLKHTSPHAHTYGTGGSASASSDTVTGGNETGAGIVTVFDGNQYDCDGDGTPGDFDGDYEAGVGGGFFGYGPWAWEPICNYGLAIHGAAATVTDALFGRTIPFVIGADDTSGPVITTDPVSGNTTCSTDGAITPGDPATDPTADADDCLSQVYVGSGETCGAGGDGGYWVFLSGASVSETGGFVGYCPEWDPECCPNLPPGSYCQRLPDGRNLVVTPPSGAGASPSPVAGTISA